MVTLKERFSVQIEHNKEGGHTKLYAFIQKGDDVKLIDLTENEFDKYEIDEKNDTHKCVAPRLKLKK